MSDTLFSIIDNLVFPLVGILAMVAWHEWVYFKKKKEEREIHDAEMRRIRRKYSRAFLLILLYKLNIKKSTKKWL